MDFRSKLITGVRQQAEQRRERAKRKCDLVGDQIAEYEMCLPTYLDRHDIRCRRLAAIAILGKIRVTNVNDYNGPWGVDAFRRVNDRSHGPRPDYQVARIEPDNYIALRPPDYKCTCTDFLQRRMPCKHIFLVLYMLRRNLLARYRRHVLVLDTEETNEFDDANADDESYRAIVNVPLHCRRSYTPISKLLSSTL